MKETLEYVKQYVDGQGLSAEDDCNEAVEATNKALSDQTKRIDKMKENEYECSICHQIYEKGWTEEEARKEEKETFGANNPTAALVCDDCYNIMMGITDSKGNKL